MVAGPAGVAPPLPWRVERDWTFEVLAADGTVVAKVSREDAARAIVDAANASGGLAKTPPTPTPTPPLAKTPQAPALAAASLRHRIAELEDLLREIRDRYRFEANSDGGIVARIDHMLRST